MLLLLKISETGQIWQKRLLVCTAVLPDELLHAFLVSGALAVISLATQPEGSEPITDLASYFKHFYSSLLDEGLPYLAALSAAGNVLDPDAV